jgi:ribosomal protein L40E
VKHYTVSVCAGCGNQASRAADHSKRCRYKRLKFYVRKNVHVIPYADYARVVNALLADKGAKCTCPTEGPEHDPACPYHGEDGTRVSFLRSAK